MYLEVMTGAGIAGLAAFVWLLCVLVAVHLLAVLVHLVKSGTGSLRRMLP